MRRIATLLSIITLLSSTVSANIGYAPFTDPLFGQSDDALLVRRQGCESGGDSCSELGAEEACCPVGTRCQLDQANHVACCPINAACTGTIDISITGTGTRTQTSPTTTSQLLSGSTTTTGLILSTTSTTPFETPNLSTGVAGGGSTVPNTAGVTFNFIPTSYANRELCTTAFSVAAAQSTACLTSLAGVNGVTVSGVGFGITVQGASGTILSSASSICSSLSASACYGLREDACSTIAPQNNNQNKGPRQTVCPGMVYAAGAGAVVGAVGVFV